jgi:hypothetical protein
MADVMNSLFGMTPESIQRQRDNELQARALQFAKLDPQQAAQMAFYTAGSRLGDVGAGLLGAKDPEMMRLQQRQGTLQGLDLTDPASLKQGIQMAMQNNDYALVSELTNRYQAVNKSALDADVQRSVITKNMREKAGADPLQQLIRSGKYTPESLTKYRDSEDPADLVLATKESKTSYGAEADRAAKANYGKDFADLTQAEAKVIDNLLETRGVSKAKAGKTDVVLPGVAKAGDVTGLRRDVQTITKPYQDQADAAGDAIDLADLAIKSNNFAAVSSLSRSLAKAAGETQLSRNDVQAFGIDPSLVGSVTDTISRLAQSRPTVDTLNQLRQLAEAIKKKAESRISIEEQQLQDTARVSGQFTEPQIQTVFRRRPKEGAGDKTAFNSVKDAEAAKLPKGTIITINGRRAVVE